jgi:hypothetical protein
MLDCQASSTRKFMFNIMLILGVVLYAILSLLAFFHFKRYEKQFGENSAGVLDKKDVREIITPGVMFFILAVCTFALYYKCGHADAVTSGDQSFEKFIQNVESGKQQLTTGKAIAIIRQGRITENTYRKVIADEAWTLQWIGWMALLGSLMTIFAAVRVRKRNTETMPNI